MLEILRSIRRVIERRIVNRRQLTQELDINDTTVNITSSRTFCVGESIYIYDETDIGGYLREITSIPDNTSVVIDDPLNEDPNAVPVPVATGYVKRVVTADNGYKNFINTIYTYDPAVIAAKALPAITINGISRSSDWLTIESTKEDFEIEITTYIQASDQEQQYEFLLTVTKEVENALFRSFYPLVDPYYTTTLAAGTETTDQVIQVTDPNFLQCRPGWIWLENSDDLRSNTVLNNIGGGAYQLASVVGAEFNAGDDVIYSTRHIFNTLPASTDYGFIHKGTMMKASVISYRCSEEILRHTPFVDPLTF